jgi:hypothetical protein
MQSELLASGGNGLPGGPLHLNRNREAMDENKLPGAGSSAPLQGPHRLRPVETPAPSTFIALTLVLQPAGPAVELSKPEMVVGRHSGVDIRLPLPDVSRRHCRFVFADGLWQVFDLDSLNGIYLNGEKVAHAELQEGDVVGIGGFKFEVHVHKDPASLKPHTEAPDIIQSIAQALPLMTTYDIEPPPQRKAS